MKIETTVLIPTFNGKKYLDECLTALEKQTYNKFKAILIDNNSNDGSIEFVEKNFPNVEIIRLEKNYGFALPMNIGIKYSIKKHNPKYIVLLNNDTKADKNWLNYLIKAAKSKNNIAAVGSDVLDYEYPNKTQITLLTFGLLTFGLINTLDDSAKKSGFFIPHGAAMLMNTEFLKEIGLFDKRYFAYYEEIDWSLRAYILGYDLVFEEKAVVYHKGRGTSKRNSVITDYLLIRNKIPTFLKNYEKQTLKETFLPTVRYLLGFSLDSIAGKYGKGLITRLKFSMIPVFAIVWNIKNLKTTLKLRKIIQRKRKIKDKEILK